MTLNISTRTRIFFLTLVLSALITSPALANTCKMFGKQLRGEYNMTQTKGGLWGYMEQAGSMKKDSVIGLQVDSKMQRLVVHFETKCEGGQPEPETIGNKISSELAKARQIVNKTPGRTPVKTIMKMITSLNQSLDKTMGELGL